MSIQFELMGKVRSFIEALSSDVIRLCDGVSAPNRKTRRTAERAVQATESPRAGRLQAVQFDPFRERKINPPASAGSSMNSDPVQDRLHQAAVAEAGRLPGIQDERLLLVMKPLPVLWIAK